MTKQENRQRIKNEAINKIAKIYVNKDNIKYDDFSSYSYAEQRDDMVEQIIKDMQSELLLNELKFNEKAKSIEDLDYIDIHGDFTAEDFEKHVGNG